MPWKGKLPGGKTYEHPIIQLDLLPTCLAATGGKVDPGLKLDGVNLLPYLKGEVSTAPHDVLYWRFGEQWAIRKGDWKLVVSRIDGPEPQLFNLGKDIGEANNLMAKQAAKAQELKILYDAWNAEQMKPLWLPAKQKKKKDKKVKEEVSSVPGPQASLGVCGFWGATMPHGFMPCAISTRPATRGNVCTHDGRTGLAA
jgi:arylsulfatase A-like enzyme